MQYINKNPDLGSGWDCGFSCGSGSGNNSSSGGGKTIWEGEFTAFA